MLMDDGHDMQDRKNNDGSLLVATTGVNDDESTLTRQFFHLVYRKYQDNYRLKCFCFAF